MSLIKFNRNTYLDLHKICSIYTSRGFHNNHVLNIQFSGDYNARFTYNSEEKALDKMEEVANMINESKLNKEETKCFDVLDI